MVTRRYAQRRALAIFGSAAVGFGALIFAFTGRDAPSSAGSGAAAAGLAAANPAASPTPAADGDIGTTEPTVPATSTTTLPPPPPTLAPDGLRSDERRMTEAFIVRDDDLQPKSVVASGTGLFVAQNMMYRHNVSVFDRAGTKIAEVDDTVDLAAFGVQGGVVAQGSPVEAAFTPDGRYFYVSNYKMYGSGFNPVADDDCNRGNWDDSYVYRIAVETMAIDQVITTGAVPKFVAVTPDGATLLVSNWCGFDLSVIDIASGTEVTRIDLGRHPRGIAVSADSRTAYVTVMGEGELAVIDLPSRSVKHRWDVGSSPRHVVLSPDGTTLYISSNLGGLIKKLDARNGNELDRVSTGNQPRTMVLAEDGASLYVVNYRDDTISKVRTSDFKILQTLPTRHHPVGVTYDAASRQVWVANYAGSLSVYIDGAPT